MIRAIGLRDAVAINVITMIGIGPLITIPLVLADLHGSLALSGWIIGALIALCDGLVWAELGSLYPGSGGTYVFLRETFGREKLGRALAFLFTWQIVLSAPLVLATGYIGFARYAGYLWKPLADSPLLQGAVAAGVGLVTLALLYRPIGKIATTSMWLAVVAVLTLLAVIAASTVHFSSAQAFAVDSTAPRSAMLAAGLGPALVITLYDYYGYGQACTVSDEVHAPARILPRSTVLSVLVVALLYVVLQIGVLGAVPWHSLVPSTPGGAAPAQANYVASSVVELGWGGAAAALVTLAILVTAFASTFGNLLGYSRIPYAAANDGVFLPSFASLHPSGRFPNISLAVIGLLALPACFLDLTLVINALTTGLVIIQSLAQIAALFALRVRGVRAPYRMWLFPLPALLATVAWGYIFYSAGAIAIAFGFLSLGGGVVVYLMSAAAGSRWPFGSKASAALVAIVAGLACARAQVFAQPAHVAKASLSFTHSAIVERDGFPVFEVDGKPFFVFGASFFYERLPRDEWAQSLGELRAMGFNTLDLYIMWNWHEPSDGDFDFSGRTNSRRDLQSLLKLARAKGFKLIVRPGPVIRNEWRNGGYPAWLLQRPEYGMPRHDLLEGRYPPTATLQNAHSDDAAAEWLANPTHLRYSARWLRRALAELKPYADIVLAVQLDDDQGAYLDNQTWPAPRFVRYLDWLASVVRGVTGPRLPLYINTYEMKVPASSPVWTMGNWYQSDAYSIGEHDRAQLEFSTGLLQTRPHQPVMLSEFQAGWLLGPDDIRPRPADPTNTLLAMTTAIGMGARGIVDFPPQDTLYPAGWEVPFANWFYAWDAAIGYGSDFPRGARYEPTARIGRFIARYGTLLAQAKPHWDAGIAYLTSALDERALSEDDVDAAVDAALEAQRGCRDASLACRLVDLRFSSDADLRYLPILFIARTSKPLTGAVQATLRRYSASGGILVTLNGSLTRAVADSSLARAHRTRSVDYAPGATFAALADGSGFLTLPNYSDSAIAVNRVAINIRAGRWITLQRIAVAARSVLLARVDRAGHLESLPAGRAAPRGLVAKNPSRSIRLRSDVVVEAEKGLPEHVLSGSFVRTFDLFGDGIPCVVLQNALVRVAISPQAGARAFVFEDLQTRANGFDTVGALRDDVAIEPPPSKTDRIAAYTHQFPAGMFNRAYKVEIKQSGARAVVRFSYDAPDVVPSGARFERTITLEPDRRTFSVDETVTFHGLGALDIARGQRALSVSSLASSEAVPMKNQIMLTPGAAPFAAGSTLQVSGDGLGYYDGKGELVTIAWRHGDVERADLVEKRYSAIARLTTALGQTTHIEYSMFPASTVATASAALDRAIGAAQEPKPSLPSGAH